MKTFMERFSGANVFTRTKMLFELKGLYTSGELKEISSYLNLLSFSCQHRVDHLLPLQKHALITLSKRH